MDTPEFKLIVAGGRDYRDYQTLTDNILYLASQTYANNAVSIVSGAASGADGLAIRFAGEYNVECYTFPANWDLYGKGAGFRRNTEMAQFADGLLAFWDGESRGTKHMIETMERMGKPVHVVYY